MKLQTVKQRFGIIGQSARLDSALSTAIRVAATDLTVLVTGESGVGKEVISKIIHSLSPRKHNSFIAVNCGAIPEGTINSELFGHVKGSFTGATSDRKGYFESVDGGTIFLDEIGEMPLETQAYLLRVLESGEFMRVGSSRVLKTDVRVIAASNIDLISRIDKGKFREDLYYRLNTVPIHIPPLRERGDDIYLLFRKFASDFAERYNTQPISLDEQARQLLYSYNWPGNIRELKNMAEQLSVMAENKEVSADFMLKIAPQMKTGRHLPAKTGLNEDSSLKERELLYKVLFEMRSDLTDLKKLVFEIMRSNNLELSDYSQLRKVQSDQRESSIHYLGNKAGRRDEIDLEEGEKSPDMERPPMFIPNGEEEKEFGEAVEIEESLSLEEMEKKLIGKALEKYGGKRKDAAEELGISERTLYRKIKEYEL